jgi:hypothetical protein
MKKTIVTALIALVLAAGCKSRGNLDGFLDIPWGESIETAARVLEEKGYSWEIDGDDIDAEGKFAGFDAEISLSFFEGKFYSGKAEFPSKKSEKDYNEYVSLVTGKYGKSFDTGKYVLKMDDKSKLVLRDTTWHFDNNASITVHSAMSASGVRVVYQDNEMNRKVRTVREEREREEREREREQEREKKELERQAAMNDL